MSAQRRVVMLTGGGPLAEVVINALAKHYRDFVVVQEKPETVGAIALRWVRLLGWRRAVGQLAFGPAQKLAAIRARQRRREIFATADLDASSNASVNRIQVPTVNSDECRRALNDLDPAVVLVVGTRMIRSSTLSCIPAQYINYHAGINPQYRGQYGAYWAMVSNDHQNAGITVHLIDLGVDTGAVLATDLIHPTPTDGVATFHYLQVAAAVPLILRTLDAALDGYLKPVAADGMSKQWFHPTLAEYLINGVRRGVW